MIAEINGNVRATGPDFVVIETSGIGYKVHTPSTTLSKLEIGSSTTLATHLVVKEDALDLYGFERLEERDFFELLIGISGIGPKGALGVFNLAPMETIKSAIASGESAYLTKVSGVGKKTADKLVLELKDKVQAEDGGEGGAQPAGADAETIEALQALGYTAAEARKAAAEIPEGLEETDEKVRHALSTLGK